ncbi:hypothetical protein F383_35738 [Gossypium arboreum]|uniref:Uncharacterized protein n=1 Tax=Gossypium arboreum TaxID=29729 RepID=A0A0B0PXT0_GOSAR|nr:hypothetical protein F383_35738 [Gossypium arboreum]
MLDMASALIVSQCKTMLHMASVRELV